MALTPYKTWIAGEVLTAADLNASFTRITNNALTLISPLTGALDINGYALTMDAAAVTTLQSTTAAGLYLTPGAKTGTPSALGSQLNIITHTYTDSGTLASGTAPLYMGVHVAAPTLAATNASVTTTDAATVYIGAGPIAGTNETITNSWGLYALGNSYFGGHAEFTHGADIASAGTINLSTATGNLVDVTGTTTITAITLREGAWRIVRFTGALTLTDGASLVLPGGANILTTAGDCALFVGYASGVVRCASYSYIAPPAVLAVTQVSDPTGTTSTTGVMMGLGSTWTLTPVRTGRILLSVDGRIQEDVANKTAQCYVTYGTGTAPANGTAATGTVASGLAVLVSNTTTGNAPVSITQVVTGLTVGTAYWIDLAAYVSSGGIMSLADLRVSAVELA